MGLRRPGPKTYRHLSGLSRPPSRYEVASTGLIYYRDKGFAIPTPMAAWYRRYQAESQLEATDWDAFFDPDETTYARYVQLRSEREIFVHGVLQQSTAELVYAYPSSWSKLAHELIAPLCYPCHALMMIAAYLASVAPAGRITMAAAFQAADEMRRVHTLDQLLHRLRRKDPEFGADARQRWELEPTWQPMRALIEKSMVVYDWGECFARLCLAIKPAFDAFVNDTLRSISIDMGDVAFASCLQSIADDASWHRTWAVALTALACEQCPENREVLRGWAYPWAESTAQAIDALGVTPDGCDAPFGPSLSAGDRRGHSRRASARMFEACGLGEA